MAPSPETTTPPRRAALRRAARRRDSVFGAVGRAWPTSPVRTSPEVHATLLAEDLSNRPADRSASVAVRVEHRSSVAGYPSRGPYPVSQPLCPSGDGGTYESQF